MCNVERIIVFMGKGRLELGIIEEGVREVVVRVTIVLIYLCL